MMSLSISDLVLNLIRSTQRLLQLWISRQYSTDANANLVHLSHRLLQNRPNPHPTHPSTTNLFHSNSPNQLIIHTPSTSATPTTVSTTTIPTETKPIPPATTPTYTYHPTMSNHFTAFSIKSPITPISTPGF